MQMQTIEAAETQAALTNAHYKGGWKHQLSAALTVVTSKGGCCFQPPLQWATVRAAGVEPPLQ